MSDRLSALSKDRMVRGLLLSAIVLVLVSFFRAWSAGTIRVDSFGLSGIPVFITFFGFMAGLAGYSVCYYKLWLSGSLGIMQVRTLAFILAGIFSLMLPLLSNDIFSLLTYGDAANRGVDVYTDVQALHISPFYYTVGALWRMSPCAYGPVSLGTARLAAAIGDGNLLVAIAVYKVLALIWGIVFIEVAYRISRLLNVSVKPFLFIVLNPVMLMQGVGQLHCDIIAVALCACMVYFVMKSQWYWSFLFAGLAVAAKMNFILMLPFLVVGLFLARKNWPAFFAQSVAGIFISLSVLAVLYFHYYTSPGTLTIPFNFLFHQNPAKSLSEVIGDVLYFAPAVITGHTAELQSNIHTPSGVSDQQLAAWLLVKKVCQLFALLMSLCLFVRFWTGQRSVQQWMRVFLRMLLLFLLFYSHVFYAWYLMILLPFVWYEDDLRFMQWLFVLTCFSNVHDIMCAVDHDTPVYYVVLPLTFLSVLVFFWRFRNNFFRSLSDPQEGI